MSSSVARGSLNLQRLPSPCRTAEGASGIPTCHEEPIRDPGDAKHPVFVALHYFESKPLLTGIRYQSNAKAINSAISHTNHATSTDKLIR